MPDETTTPEEEKADGLQGAFQQFFDHQKKAFEEAGKAFEALLPEGFKEHSNAASEEFRRSIKVLVDATIDELEKVTKQDEGVKEDSDDDDGPPSSSTGKTKVKVQVE